MSSNNTLLDDIAAIIGFSATIKLSAWFSNGSSLYIPEKVTDDCLLAKLIGKSAAEALSKEWPAEIVWVPTVSEYEVVRRRRQICRMLEQRFGTKEIARTLGMSEKRVLQITRELEADGILQPIARQDFLGGNALEKCPTKIGGKNPQEKCPSKTPCKNSDGKALSEIRFGFPGPNVEVME